MAIDIIKLKPSELIRLVNSTSQGAVLEDRDLYRHRQAAGFRISSDNKTVNLLKYVAWLLDQRHDPTLQESAGSYEAMKEVNPGLIYASFRAALTSLRSLKTLLMVAKEQWRLLMTDKLWSFQY